MITPIKKPVHRELLDWEKEFNTQSTKIRYVIERVIANFKTWRIMHTDYRRPINTFTQTISTRHSPTLLGHRVNRPRGSTSVTVGGPEQKRDDFISARRQPLASIFHGGDVFG
jgi:hypothetical protein